MRKQFCVLAACGVAGFSSGAMANLLGIGSLLGFPSIVTTDQGGTNYSAASHWFSIDSSPLAIRFSPTDPPRLVFPTGDPAARILTVDIQIGNDAMLLGGHPDEDLIVIGQVDADGNGSIDYAGVLLTGEIVAFGYEKTADSTAIFDFRFTLTGGELAPLFNGKDLGLVLTAEQSTFTGDFTTSFVGGAKGLLGPIPSLAGFSGCTPGYWRQPHHFHNYPAPYTPNTLFEGVFGRDVPGNPTLREAVKLGGGHLNALMRHATAALLNAASPAVNPDALFSTPAQVIQAFQNAFDSGQYEATKNLMEASNELGCPL